jgi:seryl-tRNA synthetase
MIEDASARTAMQDLYQALADELTSSGLLIPTAVRGVYGRSAVFERIALAVDLLVCNESKAAGSVEQFFPPVVPRETLRSTGYMGNFPHLCGSVHGFEGKERDQTTLVQAVAEGGDWSPWLSQTDMVLCPAACYHVYPTLSGTLPSEGRQITLWGYVFRHEPSVDPARLQSFRMREDIRVGNPAQVSEWRARWMRRTEELLSTLGLEVRLEVANDPFFGRGGKLMGAGQREQALKFEALAPIASDVDLTAIASINYHQDHFGSAFEIRTPDARTAHSACIGFGLERITLALLKKHGVDPTTWPTSVRNALWP